MTDRLAEIEARLASEGRDRDRMDPWWQRNIAWLIEQVRALEPRSAPVGASSADGARAESDLQSATAPAPGAPTDLPTREEMSAMLEELCVNYIVRSGDGSMKRLPGVMRLAIEAALDQLYSALSSRASAAPAADPSRPAPEVSDEDVELLREWLDETDWDDASPAEGMRANAVNAALIELDARRTASHSATAPMELPTVDELKEVVVFASDHRCELGMDKRPLDERAAYRVAAAIHELLTLKAEQKSDRPTTGLRNDSENGQ